MGLALDGEGLGRVPGVGRVGAQGDARKEEALADEAAAVGVREEAAALVGRARCLVTSLVTKHLCFSVQPADRAFSHKLAVVVLDRRSTWAILSSRIHAAWAWTLSSTLETRLNYSPSDCFANFPFPAPDPGAAHPRLEALGDRLDGLRAAFMREHEIGLTTTYNLLLGLDVGGTRRAEAAGDPRLTQLRALHQRLDRAVLDTYAERLAASQDQAERELAPLFRAVEVPEFGPGEVRSRERFDAAVFDALVAVNEIRAKLEQR